MAGLVVELGRAKDGAATAYLSLIDKKIDIWGHHTYLLLHFQRRVVIMTLWLVWQEL